MGMKHKCTIRSDWFKKFHGWGRKRRKAFTSVFLRMLEAAFVVLTVNGFAMTVGYAERRWGQKPKICETGLSACR
jgi:hypothetical protein